MLAETRLDTELPNGGIGEFLEELRGWLAVDHSDLLPLFDTFAQEARFCRRWLTPSLERLTEGSRLLEVGAGLLLVSCQLQKEGFSVTALEPIGMGFSSFSELQGLILKYAEEHRIAPAIIPISIEEFETDSKFDFAFSLNVMEHVRDVHLALRQVSSALALGGEYRFMCPNYFFPYEPHFNIPTLVSKRLTEIVFRKAIYQSSRVTDPQGTWESLNWINANRVSRIVASLEGMSAIFDRETLARTLERIGTDPVFANRRSKWLRHLVGFLVKLRIHRATVHMPLVMHPIIDCRICKAIPVEDN